MRKPFATARSTHNSRMSSGKVSNVIRFLLRTRKRNGVFCTLLRINRTRSPGSSFR